MGLRGKGGPRKGRGAEPWYRKGSRAWYVTLGGVQVRLGRDEAAAFRRWHELVAGRETPPAEAVKAAPARQTLGGWAEAFLAQVRRRARPGRTAEWYERHVGGFVKHAGADAHVGALTRDDVEAWLFADRAWAPGTRRGALVAVRRLARWLAARPEPPCGDWTAGLKPEPQGVRDAALSEAGYARLLAHFAGRPFEKCLRFAWCTGCRPQELLCARLEFHDPAVGGHGALVLPRELSKGRRHRRVIYLNAEAAALVRAEADARGPSGPLFLNARGRPWTRLAFSCAFARYLKARRQALRPGPQGRLPQQVRPGGKPPLPQPAQGDGQGLAQEADEQPPRKCCMYQLRHSFCTRALKAGLNAVAVATLMGHSDTAMVSRVYQHLHRDHAHLSSQLKALG